MARSAPNTSSDNLAPNVVTLPSSTGFNVGDLVYYKNGDYRALSSADLASATFDVNQSLPTYQQPTGSNITARVNYGGSKAESTAVLTDGNVVTVFSRQGNERPTFFITTPAGVTVVAATEISTTHTVASSSIGVAALSGGGFVVYWLNNAAGTTYVPTYVIYSNAGAVVLALTQDALTGQSNTTGYLAGVALPNGGFAFSYIVNTGTVAATRAYSSTGVGLFGWVSVGNVVSNPAQRISMAARSDSSYIVLYLQTAGAVFRYAVISAAGAILNTSTFTGTIATGTYGNAPSTATVLNDGTTFVIGYGLYDGSGAPSYYRYCFRFLPSSYVMSAETVIPPANTHLLTNDTAPGNTLSVKSLAAGGFIFVFADSSGAFHYAFFNNSGTAVSGTNANGALVFPIPGSLQSYGNYQYKNLTIVEYGGNANLFWGVGHFSQTNAFIQTSAINTTTYQLVNYQSVTDSLGTVVSSVSGLADTTAPGAAKFLASATSSQILTNSMGFTINPSGVAAVASNGIQVASAADGRFVIVYQSRAANRPVTAVVYNRFGGIIQTIAVGNGDTSSSERTVGVTILGNGTLVIAFHTASGVLTFYSYTLSGNVYSLANTVSRTGICTGATADLRFSLAGLSNNRFVVVYPNASNQPTFIVFSNSLAVLVGPSNIQGVTSNYISVAAFTGGGFAVFYLASGVAYRNVYYAETATNSFSQTASVSFGGTAAGQTCNMVTTPGNIVLSTLGNTASTNLLLASYDCLANPTSAQIGFAVTDYSLASCIGLTGAGSAVMFFGAGFTASAGRAIAFNPGLNGGSASALTTGPGVFNLNSISTSGSTGRGQICTAPGVGYNCIFAWLDANNFPTYAILYSYPSTTVSTITSGVTASAPQPITPYSNQALNGYVLQGVAVTSAPAGGTGQVQTNGIARLNSNYSVSTPASSFDFQTPNGTNIPGVKGTAIGNTVILEGRA